MPLPEWLAYAETAGFVGMIGSVAYNRVVSWRGYDKRIVHLENMVETCVKNIDKMQGECETCRSGIAASIHTHHENTSCHLTEGFIQRVSEMAHRLERIEGLLMKLNGGHQK